MSLLTVILVTLYQRHAQCDLMTQYWLLLEIPLITELRIYNTISNLNLN